MRILHSEVVDGIVASVLLERVVATETLNDELENGANNKL